MVSKGVKTAADPARLRQDHQNKLKGFHNEYQQGVTDVLKRDRVEAHRRG